MIGKVIPRISGENIVINTDKVRLEQILINLYKFIGISWYEHYYKNLQKININGITYNDTVVGNNMHTIKKEIKKEYNDYIKQIPESIIKKYDIRT